MSDPISLMAGIVFFGAVYYRAEYIRFLGPIWLAIFITERGLLFTGLGFVTATVCVVVALLVIYNSFFTKSGKKSNESTNGNIVEGSSQGGANNAPQFPIKPQSPFCRLKKPKTYYNPSAIPINVARNN